MCGEEVDLDERGPANPLSSSPNRSAGGGQRARTFPNPKNSSRNCLNVDFTVSENSLEKSCDRDPWPASQSAALFPRMSNYLTAFADRFLVVSKESIMTPQGVWADAGECRRSFFLANSNAPRSLRVPRTPFLGMILNARSQL